MRVPGKVRVRKAAAGAYFAVWRAFAENESDRRIRRINHENQYNPAFYRCSDCGRDADRLRGARKA